MGRHYKIAFRGAVMKTKTRVIISFAVLAFSAALITLGILNGEAASVFQKAVKICLECIGIG